MMMKGDQTLGDENTMQNTDDVLYSCIPETYIMLYNQCQPDNLIEKHSSPKEYFFSRAFSPTPPTPSVSTQYENNQQENRDINHTSLESDLSLVKPPDEDAAS